MLKKPKKLKIITFSEKSPKNKDINEVCPKLQKNSSFSKENNFCINNMNNLDKKINIKKINTQEGTTTYDETISKFSNSQNIKIKKKYLKKRGSFGNKKREREKILKLLKDNEKIKIPIGQRKSNVDKSPKLNMNNIENIIKNLNIEKNNNKERKDYYGNTINKNNKKKVHISFKDNIKIKDNKLVEMVPIQSFKSFNIIHKNEDKIINKPSFSRCCEIF